MALARKGGKTTSSPPAIRSVGTRKVLEFGQRALGGTAQARAHLLLVGNARHLVDAAIEKMQGRRALRRRRAHRGMDALGGAVLDLGFRVLQPGVVCAAARRIAAATVERAGRRAQHQRLHLCRMGDRVFQHRPAAHRLADQAHVGKLQMIDQRREIAGIVGGIGAARRPHPTARSRDGRSSRRCSAARNARPAATSSGDCRPARGRTAGQGRCPTLHSRDCRTAASAGRPCAPAPCTNSWG